MVAVENIDLAGVGSLLNGIHHALIGTGSGGDLSAVVKDESRLLAEEIGKPPTSSAQKVLEKRIKGDIGKVFLAKPAKPFTGKQKGSGDVQWLYAGPGFLVGCKEDRMLAGKVSLAGGEGKRLFYMARGRLPGQRFDDAGQIERGTQHAMLVNRFVVMKGAIKSLFRSLKEKVGRRDASFAETAKKLGSNSIPAKSAKHFPTGKNTTRTGLLNSETPEIVFGSDAKGVSGLAAKVKKAIQTRERKMAYKLQKILSGYAQDAKTGNVSRHAK
jgi:hypothetical protein